MAIYKSSAAAAAKARMAKRAKRQRFWKENKKRILIGFLLFILLMFVAFFTPFGPDYYYGKIQERRFSSNGVVGEGVIKDLYNLGVFYQYTMRSGDAMRIYDEIGQLCYGFALSKYGPDPDGNYETRRLAEIDISKGLSVGPPFKISPSDQVYLSKAIWRAGEIIQKNQSRQFVYNLYQDLYLDDFMEKHANVADPDVTYIVQGFVDRFLGYR